MPVVRNVDKHMFTKFNQNIPCGSRVMSIFTRITDGRTQIVIIMHTEGSCNKLYLSVCLRVSECTYVKKTSRLTHTRVVPVNRGLVL